MKIIAKKKFKKNEIDCDAAHEPRGMEKKSMREDKVGARDSDNINVLQEQFSRNEPFCHHFY